MQPSCVKHDNNILHQGGSTLMRTHIATGFDEVLRVDLDMAAACISEGHAG